jgi:hypothetical protein
MPAQTLSAVGLPLLVWPGAEVDLLLPVQQGAGRHAAAGLVLSMMCARGLCLVQWLSQEVGLLVW